MILRIFYASTKSGLESDNHLDLQCDDWECSNNVLTLFRESKHRIIIPLCNVQLFEVLENDK